jgi:hypothetical protein
MLDSLMLGYITARELGHNRLAALLLAVAVHVL